MLRRGGEVVRRTCAVRSSLHESLQLTVAIPFLFGVPPAHEMLRCGPRALCVAGIGYPLYSPIPCIPCILLYQGRCASLV